VNVVKALTESCDVFFYQVGQKLGIDRLAMYAKACGLGSITGIDLDHEVAGLFPTTAWKKRRTGIAWQGGETLSVAIGQSYNLATPMQMLVLTSAVANGGALYTPLVLKSVNTADGAVVVQSKQRLAGRLPTGKETFRIIKKGLRAVVNSPKGTGRIARIDGLSVSGKTGTAQVVGRGKDPNWSDKNLPDHLKAHAWFVAYAPSESPQIAVAVIVEHGEHGSSAAAPIAREIIRTYLKKDEVQQ
jgi:penicillin-binding protein 2